MITSHRNMHIPATMVEYANTIKMENYKTNTPSKFHKHPSGSVMDDVEFRESLSAIMEIPPNRLDYVFFSVCIGAEPHCDQLNPLKFSDITYIIPVILPSNPIITAEEDSLEVSVGGVYSFDHTKEHSMSVGDDTGCVVIMATELIGDNYNGIN